jgi:hypothetical protein
MKSSGERRGNRTLLYGFGAAALLVLALVFTNPSFSILDDESSIVVAANAPVAHTLRLFATGQGQHEHPPLSDLLLHFWLPLAGSSPSLVRLPSIIFYAFGLLAFAASARKLAGDTAFSSTMLFGLLWPFGFHFGRLAGWYSFCFLALGLLTLAYLRFIEQPSLGRWFAVLCTSFIAVASNYYCWVPVVLVFLDSFCTLPFRSASRYCACWLAVLAVAYGPLWITFEHELHSIDPATLGHTVLATFLNAGFNLFTLFISESIAPWVWAISIPAGIAIAVVLVTTSLLIHGQTLRLYFGFLGSFAMMASLGIINTKRLLFIAGWLLMALGCALANRVRPRLRPLLGVALALTVIAGWTGILDRKYYGALHFIEPWAPLAREAARSVAGGQIVVSNSPSFLFYLNASLDELHVLANNRAGWAEGPNIVSLIENDFPDNLPPKQIVFVRGVNTSATQRTINADHWLTSHCQLSSAVRLLRDDGFELKKQYFHVDIDDPYRIRVQRFDCSQTRVPVASSP